MSYFKKKYKEYIEGEMLAKRRKIRQKVENAGISETMFKNFLKFQFFIFRYGSGKTTKQQFDKVKQWLNEKKTSKPFLILHGNYGTGKTMTAGQILSGHILKGRSGFFISKKDFDLKVTNFEKEDVHEFIDYLKDVELLVIDDFLSGYITDFRFSMMYSVLDHRYLENKLTIITMNEDILKFKTKSESHDFERLKDRLKEKGYFIHFDYPSLRGKKLPNNLQKLKIIRR